MKIIIEMEGTDPKLPAVLAAIGGAATIAVNVAPVVAVKEAVAPKTTTPVQPKVEEVKVEEPKVVEGNEPAASSDAPGPKTTTVPSQASPSAQSKDTGESKIDLPALQSLAAQLLQAGERRTLKSILDENQVKSLSTAPEDAYPMLFDALTEAVSALAGA